MCATYYFIVEFRALVPKLGFSIAIEHLQCLLLKSSIESSPMLTELNMEVNELFSK